MSSESENGQPRQQSSQWNIEMTYNLTTVGWLEKSRNCYFIGDTVGQVRALKNCVLGIPYYISQDEKDKIATLFNRIARLRGSRANGAATLLESALEELVGRVATILYQRGILTDKRTLGTGIDSYLKGLGVDVGDQS